MDDTPAPRSGRVFRAATAPRMRMALAGLVGLGALIALGVFTNTGLSRLWQRGEPPAETTEQVAVEEGVIPVTPTEPAERTIRVGSGDTIIDLLLSTGAQSTEAHDAVAALRTHFNPRQLKSGQEVVVKFGPGDDGGGDRLEHMIVPVTFRQDVKVERASNGFVARLIDKPLKEEAAYAGGPIQSSLYETGVAQNVPAAMMAEMIRLYSYDVDFQRDVKEGDSFELLYQQYTDEQGQLLHAETIRYAELILGGKRLRLFRFERDGEVEYFNEKGESVKKALLRTPVDGARISSKFGARLHPILGYTTMHRGIDFAVPSGTPIMAAGNGTVEFVGINGGYGRYVRLKHTGVFSTAYAHMAGFAKGLRKGMKVRQGQVIGYVGASGLATGPHLHYELLSGGSQINPLSVKMPAGQKLEGKELARFRETVAAIERELKSIPPDRRLAQK
jgi:murein DD-endopeptidase MepM/ murein hydrolase activator NlpD